MADSKSLKNAKKENKTSGADTHICTAADKCPEPDIDLLYDLAEVFKVFGDSTRIRILTALSSGERCVLHLSEHLNMGQSAVSHQLRILRQAGLVRPRREGKEMYYSLDDEHVEKILEIGLEHIIHKTGGGKQDG